VSIRADPLKDEVGIGVGVGVGVGLVDGLIISLGSCDDICCNVCETAVPFDSLCISNAVPPTLLADEGRTSCSVISSMESLTGTGLNAAVAEGGKKEFWCGFP